jgi:hypothetical protein
MCLFKSAIVLREPRNKGGFALIHSYCTDHHSQLIRANNLRDDGKLRFARIEFRPGENWSDVGGYKLHIDEERTPEWFDEKMKAAVTEKMASIVRAMIVTDQKLLLGGAWIVPKGATVEVGPNTLVVMNYGTVTTNCGTVTTNRGTVTTNRGTVTTNYGTVTTNYGTVTTNYGTVTTSCRGATVTTSCRGATVTTNYRGATVTTNCGTVTTNYGTVITNYGAILKQL